MKRILLLIVVIFTLDADGKNSESPYVAVGQGISVPANTSPINFSHGFTYTNPAVAATYDGVQLSLEHATTEEEEEESNESSGSGAEFAIGTGNVGLGVGYFERDCENCEGKTGAIAGFSLSSFSAGLGFHEDDDYSAGVIIGTTHRLGITVDWHQGPEENDDVHSYGVGYGYVGNSVIFVLDASKKANETESEADKIIMLTPGLEVQAQNVALSVSHDMFLNDENETREENTWFGGGFKFSSGSFSLYHDYVNEWAFVLALKF